MAVVSGFNGATLLSHGALLVFQRRGRSAGNSETYNVFDGTVERYSRSM